MDRGRVGNSAIHAMVLSGLCAFLVLATLDVAKAQSLDGMVFSGQFGDQGKPADREDRLYFSDGMFWSANCVPCGFAPSPYWIREMPDGIHFRGTLHSDKRGTFLYEGVFDGRVLTVDINWRQSRWYWTIERNFWFQGHPVDGRFAGEPEAVAAIAASSIVEPPQGLDCSP